MAFGVEEDIALNPMDITSLSLKTVMFPSYYIADLIEKFLSHICQEYRDNRARLQQYHVYCNNNAVKPSKLQIVRVYGNNRALMHDNKSYMFKRF